MTHPIRPSEEQASRDALTNQTRAADPVNTSWIEDPHAGDRYLVPEDEMPPLVQERLFSRRVLIGWALAALTFWFLISFVAPIVKRTVKETVVQRLQERGVNIKVNGHPIAPAIPAIPAEPDLPAALAIPAVPAPKAVPVPTTGAHHAAKGTSATPSRR